MKPTKMRWTDGRLEVICPKCGHVDRPGPYVAAHLDVQLEGPCKGCGVNLILFREMVSVDSEGAKR